MKNFRESSPIVERPPNGAFEAKPAARSVSGSALPSCELDPTTCRLLEENESMLYDIHILRRDLTEAREEINALKSSLAAKETEMEAMRGKLGDANITARDASGRIINYKLECERLTADNKRLLSEYERVCAVLEHKTEMIRTDTEGIRCSSARGSVPAQIEQFQAEMLNLFPKVDRIIHSLKRCVVDGSTAMDRILESAQKEAHELQKVLDSVRRLSVGEESRLEAILARAQREEKLNSPGELAILIRWMVVQAFESGVAAVSGNLGVIERLSQGGSSGGNGNGAVKGSARPMIRRPTK